MKTRLFGLIVLCGAALVAALPARGDAPEGRAVPNIIFIMADDLGFGARRVSPGRTTCQPSDIAVACPSAGKVATTSAAANPNAVNAALRPTACISLPL